jgi:uncharacterized membrane protein
VDWCPGLGFGLEVGKVMEDYIYFGLARALHVVGVVLWIGGVAFVTTTLIPSLKKMADTDKRLVLFEHLHCFIECTRSSWH